MNVPVGAIDVCIVRHPGTLKEERIQAKGQIEPDNGFFDIKTPIYEGDMVEVPDPRGGVRQLFVGRADPIQAGGNPDLDHIEVTWSAGRGHRMGPKVSRFRHPSSDRIEGLLRLLLAAKFTGSQLDEIRQIVGIDVPGGLRGNKSEMASSLIQEARRDQRAKLVEMVAGLGFAQPLPTPSHLQGAESEVMTDCDQEAERNESTQPRDSREPPVGLMPSKPPEPPRSTSPERRSGASLPTPSSQQVFIVHGHDDVMKLEVARFVEQLGLEAVILHERPSQGRTIIEKLEHNAAAAFAIVLFSPDDVGHRAAHPEEAKPRARQNVVLELGMFFALLGRGRVCVLNKGDVELPSDIDGIVYLPYTGIASVKSEIMREMRAAGLHFDANKVL